VELKHIVQPFRGGLSDGLCAHLRNQAKQSQRIQFKNGLAVHGEVSRQGEDISHADAAQVSQMSFQSVAVQILAGDVRNGVQLGRQIRHDDAECGVRVKRWYAAGTVGRRNRHDFSLFGFMFVIGFVVLNEAMKIVKPIGAGCQQLNGDKKVIAV
jgi:hypothetical protein